MVGIFLPLLPTTPFLLLSASCFFRSSPKLYQWLVDHPWFGHYIKSYREHGAIPLTGKIAALVLLWFSIGYATLFAIDHMVINFVLSIVAILVTVYILRLKTICKSGISVSSP